MRTLTKGLSSRKGLTSQRRRRAAGGGAFVSGHPPHNTKRGPVVCCNNAPLPMLILQKVYIGIEVKNRCSSSSSHSFAD